MQPEVRFVPFTYTSPQSSRSYDCLRVNFDYADADLKARLKALGMRWASEGMYFYFMVADGLTAQQQASELTKDLGSRRAPIHEPVAAYRPEPKPSLVLPESHPPSADSYATHLLEAGTDMRYI